MIDAWLMLIAGPSPANTLPPRLPTYPTSSDIVDVSSRWTVTLNASTCGGRCFSGSARAKTPFGSGNSPFDGTSGKTGGGGPLREVEDAVEVLRRVQLLDREHGQVLRHAVPEERSEHADVVAAAVAGRGCTVFSLIW